MRWSVLHRILLGVLAAGVLAVAAGIGTMPARAYPADQISRGEAVWKRACEGCHSDGSRPDQAPEHLRETQTLFDTQGYVNANDVFEGIKTGHQPNRLPQGLSEQDYWDIVAYLGDQQQFCQTEQLPLPEASPDLPFVVCDD